jgi:hypothetical protein
MVGAIMVSKSLGLPVSARRPTVAQLVTEIAANIRSLRAGGRLLQEIDKGDGILIRCILRRPEPEVRRFSQLVVRRGRDQFGGGYRLLPV